MKPIFLLALLLGGAVPGRAVIIAPFPGLDGLIREADVIAIVRLEDSDPYGGLDGWSQRPCSVYQTLKGKLGKKDLQKFGRLKISFNDFVTPNSNFGGTALAPLSTHLVFLRREARALNGTNYSVLQRRGSVLPLSPSGNEKKPAGATLKLQIQSLIRRYQSYRDAEIKREEVLFRRALTE